MRTKIFLVLLFCLLASPVWATTYWIGPTSQGSNNGTSAANRWGSFATAFSTVDCGDTLVLQDGVYGDGTSTGKISLTSKACTATTRLTIRAENERQARINDNGTGNPILINGTATSPSAYIDIDGIVFNSTDNAGGSGPGSGLPVWIRFSNHINLTKVLAYNPNRYFNNPVTMSYRSQDVLYEQFEGYTYHRHCLDATSSERVVMRLSYCNGRTGRITGGYDAGVGTGKSDSMMVFYPCRDCILESSINEGATNGSHLVELNLTFSFGILLENAKILGNVCLDCNHGNGIYANRQGGTSLNNRLVNATITDNSFVNFDSISAVVRCSFCVGTLISNNTALGGGSGVTGYLGDNTSGNTVDVSMTFTKNIAKDLTGNGFIISNYDTWTGGGNYSNGNGVSYNPSLPSNWSDSSASVTTDPGLGQCLLFAPDGSAARTASAGAESIYEYRFGVKTTNPLWSPEDGQFLFAGATVSGINDVAGDSLFDVHKRLNIPNSGESHTCSAFPTGYLGSTPAQNPGPIASATGTTNPTLSSLAIDASLAFLEVGVDLYHSGGNVGSVTGVTTAAPCSDTLTQLPNSDGNTLGFRYTVIYTIASPTSGTCDVNVATTGNVTGSTIIVREVSTSEVSAIGNGGNGVRCGALSNTPTCSIPANDTDVVHDYVGVWKQTTPTAGAGQTVEVLPVHPSADMITGTSTKTVDTSLNSTMSWSTANIYWSQSLIVYEPSGGSTPPSPTPLLRIQNYRWYDAYGSEASPTPKAALNTAYSTANDSTVRPTIEIKAIDAAAISTGSALYCRKNADAYAKIQNTYGTAVARYIGANSDPNAPVSHTATTQKLSADTFTAGLVVTDEAPAAILPALSTNGVTEMTYIITLNPAVLSAGDTVNCLIYRDDGTPLDTPVVIPTLNIVPASGSVASLDTIMEKLALLLFGLAEVKTLVSRPHSNFTVDYPDLDTLQISGACDRIRTDGSGNTRTMRCLH